MAKRVEGKAAIVVGGGQTKGETVGNGRAAALVLAREGAAAWSWRTGISTPRRTPWT
jgi:NAD(P)-dependent dehydrogenase (short-subunit alcohol dehydrogenase family)